MKTIRLRDWASGEWIAVRRDTRCGCCARRCPAPTGRPSARRPRLCLDHTFLSGERGRGPYLLTVLCTMCNLRKGNRVYVVVGRKRDRLWFPWLRPGESVA